MAEYPWALTGIIGITMNEEVAVARLLTGHETLRTRRFKLGLETRPECTACNDGVPENQKHFMPECPTSAATRHRVFGHHDPTLAEAFADPVKVVEYLRRLGRTCCWLSLLPISRAALCVVDGGRQGPVNWAMAAAIRYQVDGEWRPPGGHQVGR